MTRRSAILLPVLLALVAGCAPHITVRHPLAPARLRAEDVPKLARIALVMNPDPAGALKASALGNQAALGQLLGSLVGQDAKNPSEVHLTPGQIEQTLVTSSGQLTSPFSSIAAFAVAGPATPEFLAAISPSSVLYVTPSAVQAGQEQQVSESKDKQGNVLRTVAYVPSASWSVDWRLAAWPGGETLVSGRESARIGEQSGEPVELAGWLESHVTGLGTWAAALRPQLLPRTAIYRRRMWKDKDVRKDGSGCYAAWNDGARAENAGRWEEARASYRKAYDAARNQKDKNLLSAYMASLDRISESSPAARASEEAWFAEPTALAPFANDTNNVGAADAVRAIVLEELARMGYRILPLAESDNRFRNAGISQGAQLRAVGPKKIATAVGVNRWITGTVNEFKVINVGVYYRRQARVTLALRDVTGRVIWEQAGVSVRQELTRPKDAGKAFLAGLVGSVVEKATGTFLREDALAAVRETVPYLPARAAYVAQAQAASKPVTTVIQKPAPAPVVAAVPVKPIPVVPVAPAPSATLTAAKPVTAPAPQQPPLTVPQPPAPQPPAASSTPVVTPVVTPPVGTGKPADTPGKGPDKDVSEKPHGKPADTPGHGPDKQVPEEPKVTGKPADTPGKGPDKQPPDEPKVTGKPADTPGKGSDKEAPEEPKVTGKPADTPGKGSDKEAPQEPKETGKPADTPGKGSDKDVQGKPAETGKPDEVGKPADEKPVAPPKKGKKTKKPKAVDTDADKDKGAGNEKK